MRSVSKKSTKELSNDETEVDVERATRKKKIHISRRKTTNF